MIEVPESIYYIGTILAIIGAWKCGQWAGNILNKLFAKRGKDE